LLLEIRVGYKFSDKTQTNFSLSVEFGKLTSGGEVKWKCSESGKVRNFESAVKCKLAAVIEVEGYQRYAEIPQKIAKTN
jgi:hypothetical protein